MKNLLLCLLILFCFAAPEGVKAQAATLEITVTSPWLALLVDFVGGINVKATSIQEWNGNGDLVRRIQARRLHTLPPESLIMAFDSRDAKELGLPYETYPNYRSLYNQMPLDEDRTDASLSDPSVIPFIAQRVLTVLADWDPDNYPYYQRRLAEFQARLYSTTLAGRQILKDQPLYDMTGHSGALFQAAGCDVQRPSADEWIAWSAWKEIAHLQATVSRMAQEKVIVVLDHSTPKAIRSVLDASPEVFLVPRPRFDQDYPGFLHDQYISLWSRATSVPLPAPRRRQ